MELYQDLQMVSIRSCSSLFHRVPVLATETVIWCVKTLGRDPGPTKNGYVKMKIRGSKFRRTWLPLEIYQDLQMVSIRSCSSLFNRVSVLATETVIWCLKVDHHYLYSSLLPSGLQFVEPNADPDKYLTCMLLQTKNSNPISTELSSPDKLGCRQLPQ